MLKDLLKKYFDSKSAEKLSVLFFEKEYKTGDKLFEEKDESKKEIYFIIDGVVDFYLTKEGKQKKISSATTGDFFGELSFIDGLPRSAAAIAKTDLKVAILKYDSFIKLKETDLNIYIEFLEVLLRILSYKIRKIDEELL